MLDEALDYAARGWAVLPLHGVTPAGECTCGRPACGSVAKHPRTEHGLKEATTDMPTIVKWLTQWPDSNIGLVTGVVFDVLDLDGEDGIAAVEEASAGQMPEGPISRTGRGRHHLFQPFGRNKAGLLPGVDFRGAGGYVVAPPSRHANGTVYEWITDPDLPIPDVPPWLATRLAPEPPPRPAEPRRALRTGESTAYGEKALQYSVDNIRSAVQGTRNSTLNTVALKLYRLVAGGEVSEADADDALLGAGLDTGLAAHEVESTLTSAKGAGLAQPLTAPPLPPRSEGGMTDREEQEGEAESVDTLDFDVARQLSRFRARLLDADALDHLPPPEPLVESILMVNSVAAIYGPPGAGKTFLAGDIGLCVATGFWWKGHKVKQGSVLYVAAEGSSGLAQRKEAWKVGSNILQTPGISWLPTPVNLLDGNEAGGMQELAREMAPALVVIDTVSRCIPGADENTAKDMGRLVEVSDRIRQASGCCVLLVHHTTKLGGTLRGHSSLEGAVDTAIEVTSEGRRVKVRCTKQKDAAPFNDIVLDLVPTLDSCYLTPLGTVAQLDDPRLADAVRDIIDTVERCTGAEPLPASTLLPLSGVPAELYYEALSRAVMRGRIAQVGNNSTHKYRMPPRADTIPAIDPSVGGPTWPDGSPL